MTKISVLVFGILGSVVANATDVCTLAQYWDKSNGATINAICTNPTDSKVLSRNGDGTNYVWTGQIYATMKNEIVKSLLENGYKSIDGQTYSR